MSTYVEFRADEIRHLIKEQGLKQWWVAEVVGVHKTTLRRWLNGEISRVKRERAERLCETVVGLTPSVGLDS